MHAASNERLPLRVIVQVLRCMLYSHEICYGLDVCSTAMKSVTDSLVLESLLHKDVAGRCKSVL
jgi:hypothetical protein